MSRRCVLFLSMALMIASHRSACAGPFQLPEPCGISEIIRMDFADMRISHDDDTKLLPTESHQFRGTADDLNRFLEATVTKPSNMPITVNFTGPAGLVHFEPLTPEAAQAGCDYDWAVQIHWWERRITVSVPLAARIPISKVRVPSTLIVDSGSGAPAIVGQFAKLHNERRDTSASDPE